MYPVVVMVTPAALYGLDPEEEPTAGVGVGGTTVGVDGCPNPILPIEAAPIVRDTGDGDGVENALFEFGVGVGDVVGVDVAVSSTPKLLKSGPSRSSTVPPAANACSKSRSVRETRREITPGSVRCRLFAGIGRRPPPLLLLPTLPAPELTPIPDPARKEDGGGMAI